MRSLHVFNEERQRIYATWQHCVVMHQPYWEQHCHYHSSSSAGAKHQPCIVFGAKKCVCLWASTFTSVRLCAHAYTVFMYVNVCICVRLHGIHIKQFWRWLCFPGCHEYKRKHPSLWNTISQVVTVKLTLLSVCRHSDRKKHWVEKERRVKLKTQTDEATRHLLIFSTLLDFPAASHIELRLLYSQWSNSTKG